MKRPILFLVQADWEKKRPQNGFSEGVAMFVFYFHFNTFRQFKIFLPRCMVPMFIILNKTDQSVYSNEHYKMALSECQVPILVWCKSGVKTMKIRR